MRLSTKITSFVIERGSATSGQECGGIFIIILMFDQPERDVFLFLLYLGISAVGSSTNITAGSGAVPRFRFSQKRGSRGRLADVSRITFFFLFSSSSSSGFIFSVPLLGIFLIRDLSSRVNDEGCRFPGL